MSEPTTSESPSADHAQEQKRAVSPVAGDAGRVRRTILVLLLLAAIFAAYSPSLVGDFVWDDRDLIQRAPAIHDLKPLHSYFLQGFWNAEDHRRSTAGYYRPLTTLSYAVQWRIHGDSSQWFHLFNVLLHCLNALLLLFVARKWGARFGWALAASAVFGLFPRLSESVAWISGRTDLMAAFFILAALLALPGVKGAASKDGENAGPAGEEGEAPLAASFDGPCADQRERSSHGSALAMSGPPLWKDILRHLPSALLLLAGLFCKEVAAAGLASAFFLILGRTLRAEISFKRAAAVLSPFVLAALAYATLRFSVSGALSNDALQQVTGLNHVLTVLAAVGAYLKMSLLFLTPELQVGTIGITPVPLVILGILAIGTGVAALLRAGLSNALRHPMLPLAALSLAALALVVQILPLKIHCLAADRFLYVPAIGFLPVLASTAGSAFTAFSTVAKRLTVAAISLSVAASFAATILQAGHWTNENALFSRGCANAPEGNAFACLLWAGERLEQHDPDTALSLYGLVEERERETNPMYWEGYTAIRVIHGKALALADMGRPEESRALLQQELTIFPDTHYAANTKSAYLLSLIRSGRIQEATDSAGKLFSSMEGGEKRLKSFQDFVRQIAPMAEQAGGLPLGAPWEIPPERLARSIPLALALSDWNFLTEAYFRVMASPEFSEGDRSAALHHLMAKGHCASIRSHLEEIPEESPMRGMLGHVLKSRCALPENPFQ